MVTHYSIVTIWTCCTFNAKKTFQDFCRKFWKNILLVLIVNRSQTHGCLDAVTITHMEKVKNTFLFL